MSWRPENWEETYLDPQKEGADDYLYGFNAGVDAGGDAMLEALKKEGQYWGKIVEKPAFNTTKIGWLVFIEETE